MGRRVGPGGAPLAGALPQVTGRGPLGSRGGEGDVRCDDHRSVRGDDGDVVSAGGDDRPGDVQPLRPRAAVQPRLPGHGGIGVGPGLPHRSPCRIRRHRYVRRGAAPAVPRPGAAARPWVHRPRACGARGADRARRRTPAGGDRSASPGGVGRDVCAQPAQPSDGNRLQGRAMRARRRRTPRRGLLPAAHPRPTGRLPGRPAERDGGLRWDQQRGRGHCPRRARGRNDGPLVRGGVRDGGGGVPRLRPGTPRPGDAAGGHLRHRDRRPHRRARAAGPGPRARLGDTAGSELWRYGREPSSTPPACRTYGSSQVGVSTSTPWTI